MKTHWKKLHNPDYFGAYCLADGKDMNVTIERVEEQEVTNTDGKKEVLPVAVLKNNKPLILNVTNSKMLAKLTKSNYVEDWKNLTITVYVAQVKAFGDTVDAIRIRSKLPVKPKFEKGTEAWSKAVHAVREGKATIEQVQNKYPDMDLKTFKSDVGVA